MNECVAMMLIMLRCDVIRWTWIGQTETNVCQLVTSINLRFTFFFTSCQWNLNMKKMNERESISALGISQHPRSLFASHNQSANVMTAHFTSLTRTHLTAQFVCSAQCVPTPTAACNPTLTAPRQWCSEAVWKSFLFIFPPFISTGWQKC